MVNAEHKMDFFCVVSDYEQSRIIDPFVQKKKSVIQSSIVYVFWMMPYIFLVDKYVELLSNLAAYLASILFEFPVLKL